MAKKARPKKKQKEGKDPKPPDSNLSTPEEKPFDFGGIPERDLKKNLGCG